MEKSRIFRQVAPSQPKESKEFKVLLKKERDLELLQTIHDLIKGNDDKEKEIKRLKAELHNLKLEK